MKKIIITERQLEVVKKVLTEVSNEDVMNSLAYRHKIDRIFNEYNGLAIPYTVGGDSGVDYLNIQTTWNDGQLSVYIKSKPEGALTINGYKEGNGQGINIKHNIRVEYKISKDVYSNIVKLLKDIEQYVHWDHDITVKSIEILRKNMA